jgi:hypothetical protein
MSLRFEMGVGYSNDAPRRSPKPKTPTPTPIAKPTPKEEVNAKKMD